ncbi:MAG: EAL domain-containing protein [Rhodocyclales bacterium GT-UBC]|nr:MAG: EAL domain-containing protein [Rhodocyclales bacterium GT-UBC]
MSQPGNDDLVFIDDDSTSPLHSQHVQVPTPWRILVVDDDRDVHEATEFALAGTQILGRPLQLLHAHSGRHALETLSAEPDIAVILLDVVMDNEDDGLKTVGAIRQDLKLSNTRIILRTGQPGQAPEADTITRYDINDYKTKSELNQNKLFTTLTTAIRSYDQLLRLDTSRRGLEKIVAASNQFIAEQGLQAFAEGVITQIASLIGVSPDGLVCAIDDEPDSRSSVPEFRIIAAAGRFSHLIQHRLSDIDHPHIIANLTQALRTQQSLIAERDVTLYFRKSKDEGFAAYIDSAIPICDVDQNLLEVFCTNIALCAKNVDLVTELRRDAFLDRLVGLPNRTALIAEINERLRRGARNEVLAVVDVDQFAATNDVLGHQYGDALLKATARRLRSRFGNEVFVARLAGDAFAVLGQPTEVNADHIQRSFAQPFQIEGVDHRVSVSSGLVEMDETYENGPELLKDSYIALRRAKAQGMSQSVLFSRAIGFESRERAQLLRDLRQGFDNQQLFLAFQPQVNLATGEVFGAEALLRWRQPDGSMVPPDRFIPVAEQSSLIIGMGSWLLEAALRSLHRFRAAGFPEMRMAVNISPVQLRQPDFFNLIQRALQATNTSPHNLELEITESVAVGGLDALIPLLDQLRQQGISIALDDFGTGYSSLSYLDRLPASHLKIDRSFVRALRCDGNGARIARTIIMLGREMGMTVIAEGVEDAATADYLLELGCNEAQGYHFGRPMIEGEFLNWLDQQAVRKIA